VLFVGAEILIPLTQSLYVPGRLASSSTVLVDVGTGFYVEKSAADAIKFYNAKVDGLSKNLGDLEKVVQGKNENLRIVEEGSYRYCSTVWFGLKICTVLAFVG
jgi:prefoldin alpha subunit